MTTYPAVYHKAVNHLARYGMWNGDRHAGRKLCADALRALRHMYPAARVRREYYHMAQIAGDFPSKYIGSTG